MKHLTSRVVIRCAGNLPAWPLELESTERWFDIRDSIRLSIGGSKHTGACPHFPMSQHGSEQGKIPCAQRFNAGQHLLRYLKYSSFDHRSKPFGHDDGRLVHRDCDGL